MSASVTGKCHLCASQPTKVTWCQKCQHWFCTFCETRTVKNYGKRALEVVKQIVGIKYPNCCGPIPEEEEK